MQYQILLLEKAKTLAEEMKSKLKQERKKEELSFEGL